MKNMRWIKAFAVLALLSLMFPSTFARAYSTTNDRPVFLAWPMPHYVGIARISQYPNTPWTWNFLGLNPGYQCPLMFGYLTDAGWFPNWRDYSIPEEQDMAKADPHNFQMVECYSAGGNIGANGHEGTDIKAPAGTPVYAAADGKILGWGYTTTINSMIMVKHCLGGEWDANNACANGTQWYTTYMHVIPAQEFIKADADISEGTQIGTIYPQGDNSHLHFEVGLNTRDYKNFVNPWGRDAAPWIGCMWFDQSLCAIPNPGGNQYALFTSEERLIVLRDGVPPLEIHSAEGAQKIRWAGNRIALIAKDGSLLARDIRYNGGALNQHEFVFNWANLGNGYTDFQISAHRIAALDANGNLIAKEGDLSGEWTINLGGVRAFSLSDHRLGVLTDKGEVFLKEGSLAAEWIKVADGVSAFQLIDSRIAIMDANGNLLVKEGNLSAEWKPMGENIKSFQLAGTRVAIVDKDGKLFVNDGNLRAPWLLQAEGVQSFQVASDRIVILDQNGKWKIKVGDLYQEWSEAAGAPLKEIILGGGAPIFDQ